MLTDKGMHEVYYQEAFRLSDHVDPNEELDWFSLAIGFFIAKGATPERAQRLASSVDYHELQDRREKDDPGWLKGA